ncbi:hypothetical protein CsSME_00021096 [Camellia sinensis var. sinensis]
MNRLWAYLDSPIPTTMPQTKKKIKITIKKITQSELKPPLCEVVIIGIGSAMKDEKAAVVIARGGGGELCGDGGVCVCCQGVQPWEDEGEKKKIKRKKRV